MKKIIFITDSIDDNRVMKRKELLESNGCQVNIYTFLRGHKILNANNLVYETIGDIGTLPYHKRLYILYKGIKNVIKRYKKEDVTFYLFGIQIALIYRFLTTKPYIYEEADLVHANLNNSLLKNWFESKDKNIILHSKLSIFTSEGFVQYHFHDQTINRCIVLGNKLKSEIQELVDIPKTHDYNSDKISFGFVGCVRYDSTINFIEHVVKSYPNHTFHVFGIIVPKFDAKIKELGYYENFKYHGTFKNPIDLPDIYSKIDYVLSTYDIKSENVRYAEPNKLYESVYFRTPIIVSAYTFLAFKVQRLGIGLAVDGLNTKDIDLLIESLSTTRYNALIESLNKLDKSYALDSNIELDKYIE